jgi:putative ABC transport system ATP-binding protein
MIMARSDPSLGAFCHAINRTYRVNRNSVAALRNVNKEFPRGSVTVIAGPSGSGKSSLLRILACVERPDSGSIEIGGQSVANVTARERRRLRRYTIAYIFQDPIDNLVEYLSAADQIRLAARLRGERVDDATVGEVLASVNLSHRHTHHPRHLSGGEQQRVSIACAMVGGPALVVADEPTAELDSIAAEQVLDGVRVLADRGAAFVLASHDPRVINRADHLLLLDRGRTAESW